MIKVIFLKSGSSPAGGGTAVKMPPTALILKEKKKRLTLQNNTWSSGCLAPRPHEDVSKQCRQRRPNVSYQENHLPACLQSEADHEELPWCLQHQPGRALPHHQGDGEPLFIDPMLLTGISSPLAPRITLNVAALVCVWAQVSLSLTVFVCLFVVVLLQELFVQHLALSSFNNGSGKETNTLSYSDLAHTAEETETFHFLTGESIHSPAHLQGDRYI